MSKAPSPLPDISGDLTARGTRKLVLPKSTPAPELTDAQIEQNTTQLKAAYPVFEQVSQPAPQPAPPQPGAANHVPAPALAQTAAAPVNQSAERPKRNAGKDITRLFVEVPEELSRELRMKAVQEDCTVSYLVLRALADAGFTVREEFLLRDRRTTRWAQK